MMSLRTRSRLVMLDEPLHCGMQQRKVARWTRSSSSSESESLQQHSRVIRHVNTLLSYLHSLLSRFHTWLDIFTTVTVVDDDGLQCVHCVISRIYIGYKSASKCYTQLRQRKGKQHTQVLEFSSNVHSHYWLNLVHVQNQYYSFGRRDGFDDSTLI